MRLRSQMALPKMNRSLALRALLVVGAMSAIGGAYGRRSKLRCRPGARPAERRPRKAHQYTARPRPSTMRPAKRPTRRAGPAWRGRPCRPVRPGGT